MGSYENFERPHAVVSGRIVELQRLEACERGLADAYCTYAHGFRGAPTPWLTLAERHRSHACILAARVRELGGAALDESDDEWVMGDAHQLRTLIFAEQIALRTYHDHLLDLDQETIALLRESILPSQEEILATLVGERPTLPLVES
jgi:hypothetical protein